MKKDYGMNLHVCFKLGKKKTNLAIHVCCSIKYKFVVHTQYLKLNSGYWYCLFVN